MLLRMRFMFVYLFFKNVMNLVTSGDLYSMFSMGFVLACCFGIQMCSGIMLAWMFNHSFSMSWYTIMSMVDYEFGFLIRSVHITFTSCMFSFICFMHWKFIWWWTHLVFSVVYLFFNMFLELSLDFLWHIWAMGLLTYLSKAYSTIKD